MSSNLNLGSLSVVGAKIGAVFKRYGGVFFFLLFASVYAFVILRINTLSNVQADPSQATAKASAVMVPRIDAAAAKQLESLKDNSVNVQTLFEQNRTNPFQEP
ncbi:MAG TPA: hypothetical protein VLE73_03390 [Candidatus Saccharimonadales bacterium]|nr:hypothetical protein [Candidatus Saccharimonadales bacterium]